ncbi:MAG TPA: hypothetical protein VK808_02200 [Bacteroidia bacterium]|jgi:hypothetical protein|nr:hypothetical protein [Bacteroidia bacterium]
MENEESSPQYLEAIAEVKKGKIMFLPEWGGWWYELADQLYVFTKDNEFVDTPHIHEYSGRTEWLTSDLSPEQMVRMIKGIRVSIDHVIKQATAGMSPSRELSLVKTELQLASMWFGYALHELNMPNPYPESYNPSSPVIEKHADLAEQPAYFQNEISSLDETGKIKFLRKFIKCLINGFDWIVKYHIGMRRYKPMTVSGLLPPAGVTAVTHLFNGNLWLGQCLNNIRTESEKQ